MEQFERYHPLFVEGMSGYDTRDPEKVATQVVSSICNHWGYQPPSKPVLLMLQGDPLTERGISAITRLVASALGLPRGLIVLDDDIADYHSPSADRDNVVLETRYSEVAAWLECFKPGTLARVETAIEVLIWEKNREREALDKPSLADYFPIFAMLQEISKVAFSAFCGEMTLAHTSEKVVASSVSSFYTVGLDLGLIKPESIALYIGR